MENRRLRLVFGATADVPQWINIVPMGTVTLGDGRPPFTVDREALEAVLAAWEQRGNDLVIDYEHQTLEGGPAPAAGWIKALEAREDGLWARVEWTEKAQAFITSREYRYFSPVLMLDGANRRPVELLHAALTNVPAINHLSPLVARSAWGGETGEEEAQPGEGGAHDGTPGSVAETGADMLAHIREILGLTPDARGGEILEALKGLHKEATPHPSVEGEQPEDNRQHKSAEAEAATELEQLRQQVRMEKGETLIREALATGRTSPAELARADGRLRVMAATEPEAFRALILERPAHAVIPLHDLEIAQEQKLNRGVTPEELRLCSLMGLDPDRLARHKSQQGSAQNLQF